MPRPCLAALVLCAAGACGKSGPSLEGWPAEASALQMELAGHMARVGPLLANLDRGLLFIFNPGTPLAQGVGLMPAQGPGLPPHTYDFNGPYDGNGDGMNETTLSGRVTHAEDPSVGFTSLEGQATVDVNLPLIGHVYHGTAEYQISLADTRISGSGTFTGPLSGTTTTLTIDSAAPLVLRPPSGEGGTTNLCGYNADGQAHLLISGAAGTLDASWRLTAGNPMAAVERIMFRDSGGMTTMLPSTTADLRCGGSGSIADWIGVYDEVWACLPRELPGSATFTIAVAGDDRISIKDEDPPGSGEINTFEARQTGGAHGLVGFFVSGPDGSRYREDFNLSLRNDRFSKISFYKYFEGDKKGRGGICRGTGKRR